MIEVEQLTKNYGSVRALRGISFEVGKGEVVGFVGPNGAGKSTTLRILTGFIGATSGRVRIAGEDITKSPLKAKQSLGYMPETAPLYPEMRVSEYLSFRARLKRVPRGSSTSAVHRAMERAGVTDVAGTLIGHLSKGYRQRVALADALVADPQLLILDEPTAGLDPNQIKQVRQLLKELSETHTILLSTHILSEVEATCDRALVIHRGQLVHQGRLDELYEQAARVLLSLRDPEGRAATALSTLSGVTACEVLEREQEGSTLRIELLREEGDAALEQVVRALVQAGVGVLGVTREKRLLEDVFSELTVDRTLTPSESEPKPS